MASWSVCSTPDRVVRVRRLAGDIVLCSWARQFTLTVPLSTQVYKWLPGKCEMLGVASHPGGSRNTPSRFMLRKSEISAGLMALLARKQRLFKSCSPVTKFGLVPHEVKSRKLGRYFM